MPRCVQCTISKKKCNPETRQWPDLCDQCIRSGLGCSPFTTKMEFDKLSEEELRAYQTKSQIRTIEDLIADIDCLLYLQAGIEKAPELPRKRVCGVEYHMVTNVINDFIEDLRAEASDVLRQQLIKSRFADAYLLFNLVTGNISYDDGPILYEYAKHITAFKSSTSIPTHHIATFDKATGLFFRWFKGITYLSSHDPAQIHNQLRIDEADATQLYQRLRAISIKCMKRLKTGYGTIANYCSPCKGNCKSSQNVFERIDPLLFRYLYCEKDLYSCPNSKVLAQVGDKLGGLYMVDMKHRSLFHLNLAHGMDLAHGNPLDLDDMISLGRPGGITEILQLQDESGRIPLQHAAQRLRTQELIQLVRLHEVYYPIIDIEMTSLRRFAFYMIPTTVKTLPMTPLMVMVLTALRLPTFQKNEMITCYLGLYSEPRAIRLDNATFTPLSSIIKCGSNTRDILGNTNFNVVHLASLVSDFEVIQMLHRCPNLSINAIEELPIIAVLSSEQLDVSLLRDVCGHESLESCTCVTPEIKLQLNKVPTLRGKSGPRHQEEVEEGLDLWRFQFGNNLFSKSLSESLPESLPDPHWERRYAIVGDIYKEKYIPKVQNIHLNPIEEEVTEKEKERLEKKKAEIASSREDVPERSANSESAPENSSTRMIIQETGDILLSLTEESFEDTLSPLDHQQSASRLSPKLKSSKSMSSGTGHESLRNVPSCTSTNSTAGSIMSLGGMAFVSQHRLRRLGHSSSFSLSKDSEPDNMDIDS